MTPTTPEAVVNPTWGTGKVARTITVVLELGMTTPASSVQGTTSVVSMMTVV